MKIVKHEWDEFWKALGDDWYHHDDDVPEHVDKLAQSATFEVTSGWIGWQGNAFKPVPGIVESEDVTVSLLTAFRRWKRMQSIVELVVQIDRVKEEQLRESVKALGGKIM